MGALRSLVARVRTNPWLAVGIAAAAVLSAAWLGWSIYVASDRGVNEGLGVLLAWPAMLAAVALISLPFIGIYLLVKRTASTGEDPAKTEEKPAEEDAGDEEPEDSESSDDDSDDAEESGAEEEESEGDEEDEPGAGDEGSEEERSKPEPETETPIS